MSSIKVGDLIGIPCQVSEGPFEDEQLVEFDTMDGKVSGFTTSSNVSEINSQMCIRAEVVSVERDHLVVMVEGSFFSTNGLANVSFSQPLPMAA